MKKFIDIFIKPINLEEANNIISTAKDFGYSIIGFIEDENVNKIVDICKSLNMEYVIRSNKYSPKKIEKIIYTYEFTNKKETINFIKRYRIDVVSVNIDKIYEIDKELINFLSQRKTRLEFFYSEFLKLNFSELLHVLPKFKEIMTICLKKDLTPFISSGARSKVDIRAPREILSFLKCINVENVDKIMTKENLSNLFLYETI
jgi:RNase P/RNase MRP subunit p30